jgi:hypothetical protein
MSSSLPLNYLCDLVVRVPSYSSRVPGFDFRSYQMFKEAVCLERELLSFVGISVELLE